MRKKLHPNCRIRWKGYCPNCANKWKGYWELYFGMNIRGSCTFQICPYCNFHFDVQSPRMADKTPIPFGESKEGEE